MVLTPVGGVERTASGFFYQPIRIASGFSRINPFNAKEANQRRVFPSLILINRHNIADVMRALLQ
jgi:hypothetical protein